MSERRKPSRYLVFEGNDGCGKTTIAEIILYKLASDGKDVVLTKEPGSPLLKFCQSIRQLIIHGKKQDLADVTYAHLFYADAHENLRQVVEPALAADKWVVSDRCVLSNFAYWPKEVHYVHRDHIEWFAGLNPIVFYLYVKPQICLKRLTTEREGLNEFEKTHVVNKLELIHSRYETYVINTLQEKEILYYDINNMISINKVVDSIWKIITNNLYKGETDEPTA